MPVVFGSSLTQEVALLLTGGGEGVALVDLRALGEQEALLGVCVECVPAALSLRVAGGLAPVQGEVLLAPNQGHGALEWRSRVFFF